ncbi:GNAT family N-acetyltransferase [Pseudomonas sp. TNT2022 ID1048]|uniref:GNAT family N-acetyltransferase n=1 Tax=Pseudomonas sp. TaxID=306 RepID=UPI00236073B7|nr:MULTISPECIES: GNAT family N-acetyltransferase [Pseudomonas]MDD1018672.1 GNAT family N-acetyltransferase [Pseudomonas idahonensis]
MWVAPDARGSGVAAELVDAVKSRGRDQGHECVYLDVAPENTRAAHFYMKQGFVFINEWEPLESPPYQGADHTLPSVELSRPRLCWPEACSAREKIASRKSAR